MATIVADRPELLRDYFLRLGATVSVDGSMLQVELADETTVADHVRHWSAVNGIDALIAGPAAQPVQLQQPQPQPVQLQQPQPQPEPRPSFFLERPRLGDLLLKKGLITQEQLGAALKESRETGDLLGRVMIRRQFIFEDELARTLADQLELPYVNLRVAGFDRAAAAMIPSSEGMRIAAVPIGVLGGRIRVAFADPSDETAKAVAQQFVGDFSLAVSELSEIELAWRSLDPTVSLARSA